MGRATFKKGNRTSFAVYKVSGLGKQGLTAADLVVRQVLKRALAEKREGLGNGLVVLDSS